MQNINQAADYIYQTIKANIPDALVTQEQLQAELRDLVLQKIEDQITQDDIDAIQNNSDNNFMDTYLAQKIPNYYTLIEEITIKYIESLSEVE